MQRKDMSKEIDSLKEFIFNDEVQKLFEDINNNVLDFNILEINFSNFFSIII